METQQQNTLSMLDRLNGWIQDSIMIKLLSIGILSLILLIPASLIEDLIYERQQRADDAMDEVADKWSGAQTISGPFLVIPYRKQGVIDLGKEGKQTREYEEKAFFLPHKLDVKGNLKPQILHRGIFDAVVYESDLQLHASFTKPDFKTLSIPEDMALWNRAYMVFGVTDLRGIQDSLVFTAGGSPLGSEPSNDIGVSVNSKSYDAPNSDDRLNNNGITANLFWNKAEDFAGEVNIRLNLKGSKRLDFVPAGKTTTVDLAGSWNNPSFDGEFLPDAREVT